MKIPLLQIKRTTITTMRVPREVLVIMTQLVEKETHSCHYSNGLVNICLPVLSYLRRVLRVHHVERQTKQDPARVETENTKQTHINHGKRNIIRNQHFRRFKCLLRYPVCDGECICDECRRSKCW